jgi:type II secretory pathway pseudopilin PulG
MRDQAGSTLFELLTVLAVSATLAGIAVPGAAAVRRGFAADAGARKLALVLRVAQARAQAGATTVRVTVEPGGGYTVHDLSVSPGAAHGPVVVSRGHLGARVSTNYPGGSVEFGPRGWPHLPGSASPRAGSFIVGGEEQVTLQLGGCTRCG